MLRAGSRVLHHIATVLERQATPTIYDRTRSAGQEIQSPLAELLE